MIRVDEAVCVAPTGDRCGEGAVWQEQEQALYWTDINRFLIHRLDEKSGAVKTWLFDEPPTALIRTDQADTLAVVFASRITLWIPETNQQQETVFRLQTWPQMRCNDARADPRGSIWMGTMKNNVGPDGEDVKVPFEGGVLYRIDPDGSVSEWKHEIGISNTVAWSPDEKHFYFGDSDSNIVYRYQYDAATGTISDETKFLDRFSQGLPDGSSVDSEGYLWNCRPDKGLLIRVAPDGRVEREISLPIQKPTTCTFGGADLCTLYITSAASTERLAGGLFAIRTHVRGQRENCFRYFKDRL
jgi:sugar lactone lactonase YvrE